MENPDYPQSELDWACSQIYEKGMNRVDALLQDDYNLYVDYISANGEKTREYVSFLYNDINNISDFVFRINADTPELRNAVDQQLGKLKQLYPDYNFIAEFGWKEID